VGRAREKRRERGGKIERRVKEGEIRERNRSASDGNIEEYIKKRKREGEEEGAFTKTKKTQRSPIGQKETMRVVEKERGERGAESEEKGGETESDKDLGEWKKEMKGLMKEMIEGIRDIREIK